MRDVIIIGAGGGGAVIAKELAAQGLDVLLLEAGPRHAAPEREWTHFENDANNALRGFMRFGPADRARPAWVREQIQNSAILQVSGVGGTTQHYLANSPRAMPGVFEGYAGPDSGAYDVAHRFPFSYRELIPYYEWVERTLPVETSPVGTKEEVFLHGAARLGLPVQATKDIVRAAFRPQENAILQPHGTAGMTVDQSKLVFPLAKGCTFCGHCIQGCIEPLRAPRNLKAKRSTDNSYVPMALTADLWTCGRTVTLISDAFATRIHQDGGGEARAVTFRIGATGTSHTEEARAVVMACGAVESPRLWLNSGLPNPNDQVGRGLTEHFMDLVLGVMPRYAGASKGPGSGARADFPGRGGLINVVANPAYSAQAAGLSDAGISGFYDNGLPGSACGADSFGRLAGPKLKSMFADIDRLMPILVLTDDDVEAQNRVTLSPTLPPDEHGAIPRVEVHQRARSPRTMANRKFLVEQAVELLRGAGATTVHRLHWPPTMFHIHSTMRMGSDPADSVLDHNGEARFVKRLFIADNSALANALGGPNPTLTTQALATRTAEKIFELYFGGRGWVKRGRAVSSVDPAVTRAVLRRLP